MTEVMSLARAVPLNDADTFSNQTEASNRFRRKAFSQLFAINSA
jgi:hypothetical protein